MNYAKQLPENLNELCCAAIRLWGSTSQMNQVQEECGELIAAINRLRRGRIKAADLAGEVADVIIMITQARIIVEELGGDVGVAIVAKLARLDERLHGRAK